MNIYLVITIGGLLGIFLHVLVAMQTINKNTPKADFNMVWQQYWKTDTISFAISIIFFMIYVFTLSEFIDLNHIENTDKSLPAAERILHGNISTFIKTVSVGVGYFADYLAYKLIGKTKKVIDKKLADEGITDDDKKDQ